MGPTLIANVCRAIGPAFRGDFDDRWGSEPDWNRRRGGADSVILWLMASSFPFCLSRQVFDCYSERSVVSGMLQGSRRCLPPLPKVNRCEWIILKFPSCLGSVFGWGTTSTFTWIYNAACHACLMTGQKRLPAAGQYGSPQSFRRSREPFPDKVKPEENRWCKPQHQKLLQLCCSSNT